MDAKAEISRGSIMKTKRSLSDPLVALKMLALCEDLTPAERRVAAALIDHRNHQTGRCDPSLDTLSRELGIHRRTVIRATNGLVNKGYLRKHQHGGFFHRNGYEFVWERFRALHAAWERHRESVRRKRPQQDLSPCRRQTRHLDGGADATQTFLSNHSKETCDGAPPQPEPPAGSPPKDSKWPGKVSGSEDECSIAQERFHVKSSKSSDVVRDVAERRWNDALLRRYRQSPDEFAKVIEAIDDDLRRAATDAESKQSGGGMPLILSCIALRKSGAS